MSDGTPRDGGSRPQTTVGAIIGAAAIGSALVALFLDPQLIGGMGRGMNQGMHTVDLVTEVQLFLSTFNVLLLLVLTWSYSVLYRDLSNRFTLSLLLVSVALLLYAVTSNPVIHLLFGFRGSPTLGPFAFLPDLFAAVAVSVLLYQSFQ